MRGMDKTEKIARVVVLAVRAEDDRIAIVEERLHMTRYFYQLQKLKNSDARFGFLSQPSFICIQIGQFLPSRKTIFTNDSLRDAIDLWCSELDESKEDPEVCEEHRLLAQARYGHISEWNTSQVTDMHYLFLNKHTFSADLHRWDTSNVITMNGMFYGCHVFNGDIHAWNMSNVIDITMMFYDAFIFNRDINAWDTSKVEAMEGLFLYAGAFNGDISTWNVSSVTTMHWMFGGAKAFTGDIHAWDVSNVTDMYKMFELCPIPERNKCRNPRGDKREMPIWT